MKIDSKQHGWLKAIIFIALAVIGVVLRSLFVVRITEFPMIVDHALLLDKTGESFGILSLEKIYTTMFSFFFSLVGNKASLAIYFQIILQVCAIMLLFYAVKIMSNKITAWASYVLFVFTPIAFSISVDQLFFMITGVILFSLALYVYVINRKERSITLKWMFSFLISFTLTRLVFIESIFVCFVIFGLLVAIVYADSDYRVMKTKIVCTISYSIAMVLSITIYFLMECILKEEKMIERMVSFLKGIFIVREQPWDYVTAYFDKTGLSSPIIYLILGVGLCFIVLSFLYRQKKASIIFFALLLLILSFQTIFETTVNPYIVLCMFMVILIVIGIQTIVMFFMNSEKTEKDSSDLLKEENAYENIEVNEKIEKNDIEESKSEIKEEIREEIKEEVKEEVKEEIKNNNFFENPLPGPKKHVPKTLDYRFEPKVEDMHYDLDE